MCGINGLFCLNNRPLSDGNYLIQQMNKAIVHRGPDDHGFWMEEKDCIYMGHQRLSILDLSEKGHQPMHSASGTTIVYNGEIYNFKEIKRSYPDRHFFSATDTEVILASYDKKNEKCLHDFNGMYAFAIWDSAKKKLFLARDRVGIKPLYYTIQNDIFAFSSEIKALLALPWIKAQVDEEDLYHFLTFNKVFPPKTMFENIYKFHPGYKMTVGEGGIQSYEPYWDIEYSDYSTLSEAQFQEKIQAEVEKAVQLRLISDVPTGAFLSGGVDSSIVVSLIQQNSSSSIKTFSIGFQDAPDYDELIFARKIARNLHTDHKEKVIVPNDLLDFLPRIAEIFDEPLADATSIPIYFISQLARENGAIVVLTGDGADELFLGYRNWMRYVKLAPFFCLYSKLPELIKTKISCAFSKMNSNPSILDILSRAEKGQEFFWGGAGAIKESFKKTYLSEEFSKKMMDIDSYKIIMELRQLFEKRASTSNRILTNMDWMTFVGLKQIIPNFYMYRDDRLGMANSIELRVPFLDHNVVNLASSIHGKWKVHNNTPKYILKKSFEHLLSKETLERKKQGFCVPLREWAGGTICQYIEENLKTFCRDTGFFNESGIKEHLERARIGSTDQAFSLWNIYFLMCWFKKWFF